MERCGERGNSRAYPCSAKSEFATLGRCSLRLIGKGISNRLTASECSRGGLIAERLLFGQQKTPPIACATRRGRNREEADYVDGAMLYIAAIH